MVVGAAEGRAVVLLMGGPPNLEAVTCITVHRVRPRRWCSVHAFDEWLRWLTSRDRQERDIRCTRAADVPFSLINA
ncbi:hypothetical protein GCM10023320_28090 [Pseudonocardia adelaidensis]|uniref:Uncharacterized protein n=1 Tax=Pseudonocardia adelaidensis TaxID=648754 RepID=A0ABP9NHN1_9PSEU